MQRLKVFIAASLLACCVLFAGCANTLPKPVNANGSVNPSVAVAEAAITYRNAATDAATYITTCHAAPTTIGCSEATITALKSADAKAYTAVEAAITAVKTLPAGATGIDAAIADMSAAIAFLQGLLPKGAKL